MKKRLVAAFALLAGSTIVACGSSDETVAKRAKGPNGDDAGNGTGDSARNPNGKAAAQLSPVDLNAAAFWATAAQRDTVVVTGSTLTFPKSEAAALKAHRVGEVIVSDRSTKAGATNPFGYMRRITAITETASGVVITTTPASLTDVIARGDWDVSAYPTELSFVLVDGAPAPSGASTAPDLGFGDGPGLHPEGTGGGTVGLTFAFDRSGTVLQNVSLSKKIGAGSAWSYGLAGELKASDAHFKFSPSVTFKGKIESPGWSFSSFNPKNWIKRIETSLQGDVDAGLVLKGKLTASFSGEKEIRGADAAAAAQAAVASSLGEKKLELPAFEAPPVQGPPIPTPLGPIPVTYRFKVKTTCSVAVEGSMEAELGATTRVHARAGLIYEKGDGWSPISEFDASLSKVGPNITFGAAAKVRCEVKPTLEFLVADAAGPSIYIGAYLEGKGSYEETCPPGADHRAPDASASLQGEFGIVAGAGAELEVFGVELASYSTELYSKALYQTPKLEVELGNGRSIGWCTTEAGGGGAGGSGAGGSGSTPVTCGNGKLDGVEDCDGGAHNADTCASLMHNEFATGTPTCGSDCTWATESCKLGACHDVHTKGAPQFPSCGACVKKVCDQEPYCCTQKWDFVCTFLADGC